MQYTKYQRDWPCICGLHDQDNYLKSKFFVSKLFIMIRRMQFWSIYNTVLYYKFIITYSLLINGGKVENEIFTTSKQFIVDWTYARLKFRFVMWKTFFFLFFLATSIYLINKRWAVFYSHFQLIQLKRVPNTKYKSFVCKKLFFAPTTL